MSHPLFHSQFVILLSLGTHPIIWQRCLCWCEKRVARYNAFTRFTLKIEVPEDVNYFAIFRDGKLCVIYINNYLILCCFKIAQNHLNVHSRNECFPSDLQIFIFVSTSIIKGSKLNLIRFSSWLVRWTVIRVK